MEENGRKRKETARIQHMGRDNQTSARQIKIERTRSWPHSPPGDRELSQERIMKREKILNLVFTFIW